MAGDSLRDFLLKKMKMSGPYQPVIIKLLLENGGQTTTAAVAEFLAGHDREALAYYESRLKINPKRVLEAHGVAEISKKKIILKTGLAKDPSELNELIRICDDKILEWYERSKTDERLNSGWGLKRVRLITERPYCELCGRRPNLSKGIELDIDHIKPRSKGGSDDIENLQVLCSYCNRAKSNHLIKSAAQAHSEFLNQSSDCVFCEMDHERVIQQNEYCFLVRDAYPVTSLHSLVIPVRHVSECTELSDIEILEIHRMSKWAAQRISEEDPKVSGFNFGFNMGVSAGQTVFHAHFHVIPRRNGDVVDPSGGIRHVIPGKGHY